MKEQVSNSTEYVDLRVLAKKIIRNKRLFIKTLSIAFVLSVIWIFPKPRYYKCDVTLAPESTEGSMGGLSSLAAQFGFDLGGGAGADAIYPTLYPDLFESNTFLVDILEIQVTTEDGELTTDYYTYLKDHQKKNYLTYPFTYTIRQIKKAILPKKQTYGTGSTADGKIDPFRVSEATFELLETVKTKVTCSVDRTTSVFTISVEDQDPYVSATLADSVRCRLQDFVTKYRTSKSRMDVEYYQKLADSAYVAYNVSLKEYSDFCDQHKNAILQNYISERDKLENEMSIRFNTYNAMMTQLQAVRAKVQERTPAFTVLKSASVPIKPAGPKRMIFVAAMLFLTFLGTCVRIVWDDIRELLLPTAE